MKRQSPGFTLTELLAVLVIISILAVFVNTSWQGSNIAVVTEANRVAGAIRYAQALSMSSGQRYRFVITTSNAYQILNAAGTPVIMAMGGSTSVLASGITFGSLTNLPNKLVAFNTQGAPYVDTATPGTALGSAATIPVVQGSFTRVVAISPNTGRVIVQ